MAHPATSKPALEPLAVSVDTATQLAGVGRTALYEAIGQGGLASCKVGSRRLILVEDLRAWLVWQRHGATPPAPITAPATQLPPPASADKVRRACAEVGR
jgi:excisionase family DNA binding protein